MLSFGIRYFYSYLNRLWSLETIGNTENQTWKWFKMLTIAYKKSINV